MKKLINIFKPSNILAILSLLLILWMFISWVEVITHNGPFTTDYNYSDANFFVAISRVLGE